MSVFLSIIVPMYNIENFIHECLESLRQQKDGELEFLFIDDGSTDNSAEVIKSEMQNDDRIKYIKKTNGGVGSARNRGITEARGQYVGFVDGDDSVEAEFFDKLAERARNTAADVVQAGFAKRYMSKTTLDVVDEPWLAGCLNSKDFTVNDRVRLILGQPTIWRRIYKKSFLDMHDLRFMEEIRLFDDLPFQFVSLLYARTVVAHSSPRYLYRLDRPGQDVTIDDDRMFVHFVIFEHLRNVISKANIPEGYEALKLVSEASHKWASGQIRPDLRERYNRLATDCAAKTNALAAAARGKKGIGLHKFRARIGNFFRVN